MSWKKNQGFSMLELMMVIAIGFTMTVVSVMALMPMFKENHVDQAYDTTLSVLRNYRNLAISQTNRYIITFNTTSPPCQLPSQSCIQVQIWGYVPPPAVSPAPINVATYPLPQDIQFAVQAGFPSPGPDGFGAGAAAYAFQTQNGTESCVVVGGGNPCLVFYPDGSAQDDSGPPGNYASGVIYITRPASNVYSSRAIDIWGTTGRIRGWRLYSESGVNTWVQQ
jgi:type II secretory pathway pseudopilin PulG